MLIVLCCRSIAGKGNKGLIARATLQLNLNINMTDKGNLPDEVTNAFAAESDNIESLCFTLSDNGIILGRNTEANSRQFHEEMLGRSSSLSNGRVFVCCCFYFCFTEKTLFEITGSTLYHPYVLILQRHFVYFQTCHYIHFRCCRSVNRRVTYSFFSNQFFLLAAV